MWASQVAHGKESACQWRRHSQSVQLLSCVQLFAIPWIAAHQASLSITISQSLLKLMSIMSMMPSNHLILCHPLLLAPSIFPSIRVFSKKTVLHIRWPKYWSFNYSISTSNEYLSWFPLGLTGLISLQSKSLLQHRDSKASNEHIKHTYLHLVSSIMLPLKNFCLNLFFLLL